MNVKGHRRTILQAVIVSLFLNFCLVLSGLTSAAQRYATLARIVDAISWAPGILATSIFAPKQHTEAALVKAMIGALVCSLVFYAVATWVILEFVRHLRSERVGIERRHA